MLRAVTGLPFSAESLVEAARRISRVRRLFNEREGWTPAEDTLPDRFFEETLPSGAARGVGLSRDKLGAMMRAYNEARGLEEDGRVPRDEARDVWAWLKGETGNV
jgi:aldehyde:ferredoxin oxidoreductase